MKAPHHFAIGTALSILVQPVAGQPVSTEDDSYDRDLCETAQYVLVNGDKEDFAVVVQRSEPGAGFGLLQMGTEAAEGNVLVAMLTESVTIDETSLDIAVWCKMVNQDRVRDELSAKLEGPPRACRDVNEQTYELALARLTPDQRERFQQKGKSLQFIDDYNAGAGAAWIPSVVNDYIHPVPATGEQKGYLEIQAPSVQVPWDPVGRDWYKGVHSCKLITRAAMERWMTGGGLTDAQELFPRSKPVCTEPSQMGSSAGSCIQFFGPADATFCTDYSGSGWTVETARDQCGRRHTTRADWLARERSYEGTGGIFSTESCSQRNAVEEILRPPILAAASRASGTCVFRCKQSDETLWHTLTPVAEENQGDRGMQRACDLFISP